MMKYFYNIAKYVRKLILYRILRLQTHGVRVILRDSGKILLIKHPYDDFWVFPGGGIKRGEDPERAARREIMEETEYKIGGDIQKLGTYTNTTGGKNDIVHVFMSKEFTLHNKKHRAIDKLEVQKSEWFGIDNTPNISKATEQRIKECAKGETNIQGLWMK